MWQEIRQKITEAITANITKVRDIYRTNRSKFAGYPAITVSPSEHEADYHDTSKDKLIFVFTVTVYYPMVEGGEEQSDLIVEELLDELLNLFLDRKILGNAVEWLEPVNSVWGYQDRENSQVRVAELKLRCRKYLP